MDFQNSFTVGFCNKFAARHCYISHHILRMSLLYLVNLLLQTRLTFSKLLMVFMGVSQVQENNLILVDPELRLMSHTAVTCS